MNGRTTVPVKAWQAEQKRMTADRFSLCEIYYRLRDETRSIELLLRGAENLMREDVRERGQQRSHNIDL